MVSKFKHTAAYALFFLIGCRAQAIPTVILREQIAVDSGQSVSFTLMADQPLRVRSSKKALHAVDNHTVITITAGRKKLFANGVLVPHSCLVLSCGGVFFINNQPLSGQVFVVYHRNTLWITVINHAQRHATAAWKYHLWNKNTQNRQRTMLPCHISDYSCSAWKSKMLEIEKSVKNTVQKECQVRVLLAEKKRRDTHVWEFAADGGFMICEHYVDGKIKESFQARSAIKCMTRRGIFSCNGKRIAAPKVTIIPRSRRCQFNGKCYAGSFTFVMEKEIIRVINNVGLEEYIAAVLHSESWPGWPLEVNKAFAIACRSYVLAMMARAQKNKKPYHIKDTNEHQRYNLYGMQHVPLVYEAVAQTRGLFLMHNNEPIVAMFDSCCGGVIPAHISDFDFSKVPYLARTYACTFCKASRLYSWQVAYTHAEFERLLHEHGYALQPLTHIEVHKKDMAGLVQEVVIKNRKKSVTLSGKKLYSLNKSIKSYCFTIQKKGPHICIAGKGFGHHLGLCQWGARQMIDAGYSYRDILRFYYPGTKFAKISAV